MWTPLLSVLGLLFLLGWCTQPWDIGSTNSSLAWVFQATSTLKSEKTCFEVTPGKACLVRATPRCPHRGQRMAGCGAQGKGLLPEFWVWNPETTPKRDFSYRQLHLCSLLQTQQLLSNFKSELVGSRSPPS